MRRAMEPVELIKRVSPTMAASLKIVDSQLMIR